MDTTSVHNILSAITEAKVALDREPEYKARIADLESFLTQREQHIEGLEINARNYKYQIEELQSKVRSLEVERDDASFRNLELEDKVTNMLQTIRSAELNLGEMADGIDPSGSQFEKFYQQRLKRDKEAEYKREPGLPPSVEPISDQSPGFAGMAGEGPSASPLPPSTTPSAPTTEATPASVSSVQEPSSVSDTSTELPYKGKTYTEVFGSLNAPGDALPQWEARGGSYHDYCR